MALSVIGVLVIAGVVALILVLTSESDPRASAQGTADSLVRAYNVGSAEQIKAVTCPNERGLKVTPNAQLTLNGPVNESGETAEANATIGIPGGQQSNGSLSFRKEGEQWCFIKGSAK